MTGLRAPWSQASAKDYIYISNNFFGGGIISFRRTQPKSESWGSSGVEESATRSALRHVGNFLLNCTESHPTRPLLVNCLSWFGRPVHIRWFLNTFPGLLGWSLP